MYTLKCFAHIYTHGALTDQKRFKSPVQELKRIVSYLVGCGPLQKKEQKVLFNHIVISTATQKLNIQKCHICWCIFTCYLYDRLCYDIFSVKDVPIFAIIYKISIFIWEDNSRTRYTVNKLISWHFSLFVCSKMKILKLLTSLLDFFSMHFSVNNN